MENVENKSAENAGMPASKRKSSGKTRVLIAILVGLLALALFWTVYYIRLTTPSLEMGNYAGDYVLSVANSSNVSLDESGSGLISLTLNADGSCHLETEGEGYAGRWTLNGENVSITCGTVKLSGVVSSNGRITLNDVMGSGLDMILVRDDIVEVTPTPVESPTPTAPPIPEGKYTATSVEISGTEYGNALIKAVAGGDAYATIYGDGTGEVVIPSMGTDSISYDGVHISYQGMLLDYSVSGTTVTVKYSDSITLILEKAEE